MDTPLPFFVMNPNTEQTHAPNINRYLESDTTNFTPDSENANQNQRRRQLSSRSQANKKNKKKTPQRGMGVAQLERLRLQEAWKTLTGTTPKPNCLGLPPQQATPFHYGQRYCYYGVPVVGGGNGNEKGLVERKGGRDHETKNRVFGLGGSGVVVNPLSYCNMAGGAPTVFETSRELSSMPKVMYYPQQPQQQHCDVCLQMQKKRSDEEKLGHHARRDNVGQSSSNYGYGFVGFNRENNPYNFNREMGGFSARAARSAFHANNSSTEALKLAASQMKGNSVSGRGALTEYEFFPAKNGKSTHPKEVEFASEASVAVGGGGEANSCVTTSDYSGYCSTSNASSFVDLSLKLSN